MSTCTCTACQTKIVAYMCSTPTGCGCRPQLALKSARTEPAAAPLSIGWNHARRRRMWSSAQQNLAPPALVSTRNRPRRHLPRRADGRALTHPSDSPRHVASPCGRGLVRAPHARPPPPSRTPHHPILPRVPSSCSPPLPPLARHAPWTAAPAPGKEKPWSSPPVLVVAMCRRPSLSDWQAIALSDVPMRPS